MEKKLMRAVIGMFLVVLIMQTAGVQSALAETIYTKTDREIKAKISEIEDGTIWYETTVGDMVECIGIDVSEVKKIENDDGTSYVIEE